MPGEEAQVAIIVLARDQATKVFGQVGKGAKKFGEDTEKAAKGLKLLSDTQTKTLREMRGLGVALSGLSAAGAALITTSTMTAARNQELGLVLKTVGINAGYSQRQLSDYEEATKGMGITTSAARQSLVQLVQAEIDLAHSADLARLAQDAAVIAQMDSSEAFNHLITALQRGDPIMMRTLGLAVDFQGAYKEMANQLGKSAQSLTAQEKMQARLNETMKAGRGIAGSYEAAMGAAGKRMRSLNRHWEEATAALGEHFLPMLTQGVDVATDLLKSFNALDEGTKNNVSSMLGMGTAATGATGAFILLAPKVAATVEALTALGVGAVAIIPVLAAVAATAAAVYKTVEFSAEVHEHHERASNAFSEMLAREAAAGKSAAEIVEEYTAAVERMNKRVSDAPAYAQPFINSQKMVDGSLDDLNDTLIKTSNYYDEYKSALFDAYRGAVKLDEGQKLIIDSTGEMYTETTIAAGTAEMYTDEMGNLMTRVAETDEVVREYVGTIQVATMEEWAAVRSKEAVGEASEELVVLTDEETAALEALGLTTEESASRMRELVDAGMSADDAAMVIQALQPAGEAAAEGIGQAGAAAQEAAGYFSGLYQNASQLGQAFTEGIPSAEDIYGLILDTGRASGLSAEEIGNMAVAMGVANMTEVEAQIAAADLAQAWNLGGITAADVAVQTGKLEEATRLLEEADKLEEEGQLAAAEAARRRSAALVGQVSSEATAARVMAEVRDVSDRLAGSTNGLASSARSVGKGFDKATSALKRFREEAGKGIPQMSVPSAPAAAYQYGGRAMKGRPVIVGDRGPEMFVPFSSGTVLPNNQMVNNNATHTYHVNIHSAAPTANWQHSIEFAQMLA